MEDCHPIPPGRKMLNSHFALDSWLAAHTEFPNGFPTSLPQNLTPHVFDRIKHYWGRDRESLEIKEKRKKAGNPIKEEIDELNENNEGYGLRECVIKVSPSKNYRLETYPADTKEKTIAKLALEQE